MRRLCRLINPCKEVEGKVQPPDGHLLTLVDLLEVEMVEILKIVVTGIDTLHVQLPQLDLLQPAQLLVAEVQHGLGFGFLLVCLHAHHRTDLLVAEHIEKI